MQENKSGCFFPEHSVVCDLSNSVIPNDLEVTIRIFQRLVTQK